MAVKRLPPSVLKYYRQRRAEKRGRPGGELSTDSLPRKERSESSRAMAGREGNKALGMTARLCFANPAILEGHYRKHGVECARALGRGSETSYTVEQYLNDANEVIQSARSGSGDDAARQTYRRPLDGNRCALVGVKDNVITTFHIEFLSRIVETDSVPGELQPQAEAAIRRRYRRNRT
jgi:hypothetical protein